MTIAVDFDGTIVTNAYPEIGKPIVGAIETLLRLKGDGHNIILWSCRQGELLQQAIDYCASKGLTFYAVNANYPEEGTTDYITTTPPRKVIADIYIDDCNIGGLPSWKEIYRLITRK